MPDKPESTAIIQANAEDLPFLREMVYEAAYWRPGTARPPLEQALRHPELAKLLADWGRRDGDAGVLAIRPNGDPIGAAWYRFWTDDNHSYGYAGPEVPEIAIAVAADFRSRGIGKQLMTALMLTASRNGIARLSLSVEKDNPAQHLYRQFGFHEIGTVGNAWTMIADVPDLRPG